MRWVIAVLTAAMVLAGTPAQAHQDESVSCELHESITRSGNSYVGRIQLANLDPDSEQIIYADISILDRRHREIGEGFVFHQVPPRVSIGFPFKAKLQNLERKPRFIKITHCHALAGLPRD